MTVLPLRAPSLVMHLLQGGIPPSLLFDLLDPEGMRLALASELTTTDVAQTPAPAVALRKAQTA